MKNTRRILSLTLLLVILTVALIPTALADSEAAVVYGMFHLRLRRNPIMAQYGVTIIFDGIEVGHTDQGEQITFGAYMLEDASHELILRADKSGVPDYNWTIASVQNGTSFTCMIKTHRHYIDIPETEIGIEGATLVKVAPDVEKTVRVVGTVVQIGAGILLHQSGAQ